MKRSTPSTQRAMSTELFTLLASRKTSFSSTSVSGQAVQVLSVVVEIVQELTVAVVLMHCVAVDELVKVLSAVEVGPELGVVVFPVLAVCSGS